MAFFEDNQLEVCKTIRGTNPPADDFNFIY